MELISAEAKAVPLQDRAAEMREVHRAILPRVFGGALLSACQGGKRLQPGEGTICSRR